MGALSKICNKTGIKQWTSNKKSQMSPETLANTGVTNLKYVHLDQKTLDSIKLSKVLFYAKNGLNTGISAFIINNKHSYEVIQTIHKIKFLG